MNTSMRSRYRLADKAVWRVGYGAMQLAGDGVFGPPRDRDEAIAVLRAAVDAGVDHIDTAQYYGPGVVNELIRDALHPYPDELALVSKVAARRDDFGAVLPFDNPDQLRAGIEDNLATLGVDQLTAVNLRVMDNAGPDARFVDQLGALMTARDEGLIGGIGISNVSHDHLMRALRSPKSSACRITSISRRVTTCRSWTSAVRARSRSCRSVPWVIPRAQREAILTNPVVNSVAAAHDASAAQVALAWLLAIAPNILLIPGTRTRAHLAENLGAGEFWLSDRDIDLLNEAFR